MVGKSKTVKTTVETDKLACTVGSGALEVYATPMMLALMEKAASELLGELLEQGQTSVGTHLNVAHNAATPLGMEVEATATIVKQDGRKVEFEVVAKDAAGEIGKGTHTRFIVDSAKFQAKANAKAGGAN